MKRIIWEIGIRLTERDAKYAIKAGMATAILSAPAFFDATRPTFVQYYGDWALISVRDAFFFLFVSDLPLNCSILLSSPQLSAP